MNMLATLQTDNSIAQETDVLGGGSRMLESGLYPATIALAYLEQSKGGALALNLTLKTEEGREVRQQLWMTSGREKGQKNYYEDKQGAKHYLPGFNLANSLCLLTVAKEISQLETEKKVVKLYSYETKSEVPTQVDALTDLIGKEIIAGVIKQVVDKNVKNEATGEYVPSGETREENEIDKFFRARDKMTTAEIRAQAEEPAFYNAWGEKWNGVTRDKSSKTSNKGTAGAPKLAASNGKPTSSLFS